VRVGGPVEREADQRKAVLLADRQGAVAENRLITGFLRNAA